jgi:hypothetical protein
MFEIRGRSDGEVFDLGDPCPFGSFTEGNPECIP